MLQKSITHNRQVQRTKGWIFEAVMILMDEKPYNKITVQDITEKAGVARQTFYRNYEGKDDVIFEYLANTLKTELLNIENSGKTGAQNNITLVFNYAYMIERRANLKKILSLAEIESRIFTEIYAYTLEILAHYKDGLSSEEYHVCRYKLVYQMTGCLQVLFDWFIHDMPLPVDKLFSMLNAMNIPKAAQYRSIPNIVVRVKEGA